MPGRRAMLKKVDTVPVVTVGTMKVHARRLLAHPLQRRKVRRIPYVVRSQAAARWTQASVVQITLSHPQIVLPSRQLWYKRQLAPVGFCITAIQQAPGTSSALMMQVPLWLM